MAIKEKMPNEKGNIETCIDDLKQVLINMSILTNTPYYIQVGKLIIEIENVIRKLKKRGK